MRFRRLFKINCWHRAYYESSAMWHLYAESGKGVAITSSPDRLGAAIKPFRLQPHYGTEDVWGGAVRYHDLMAVRLPLRDIQLYCCKHQAFSWECEFRLIISLMQADEFAAGVPDDGVEVDVDLDILIERIMLGPELSREGMELAIAQARKIGLGDRLVKSSLLGQPRFV